MARGPKAIDLKRIVDEALAACTAQGHRVGARVLTPEANTHTVS
jgi:hypothetical protein